MNDYLFTSGNVMSAPSGAIGGGRQVWLELSQADKLPGGYSLDLSNLPVGTVLQAGTPIKVNETTRVCTPHLSFSVYETAALGATALKVNKNLGASVAYVGMFIMAAPATLAGTGTGIQVTAIDRSNAEYDVFTVAALAAAVTAGAVYVECDKASTGAVIKNVPSALTVADTAKLASTDKFSCTPAVGGQIYERRIPPCIDAFKAVVPNVIFLKSK